MSFVLGSRSRAKLQGVKPALVRVVERAIAISEQDFGVFEGLRTIETQRAYVARGVTKTMNSRHLTGDAVDLVPWIAGGFRWEWPPIYLIASAMRAAAEIEAVALRWGGVWDRQLSELGNGPASIKRAVEEYCRRHPGPDFLDGPHFELMK